jgi:hypothetical protein
LEIDTGLFKLIIAIRKYESLLLLYMLPLMNQTAPKKQYDVNPFKKNKDFGLSFKETAPKIIL